MAHVVCWPHGPLTQVTLAQDVPHVHMCLNGMFHVNVTGFFWDSCVLCHFNKRVCFIVTSLRGDLGVFMSSDATKTLNKQCALCSGFAKGPQAVTGRWQHQGHSRCHLGAATSYDRC